MDIRYEPAPELLTEEALQQRVEQAVELFMEGTAVVRVCLQPSLHSMVSTRSWRYACRLDLGVV